MSISQKISIEVDDFGDIEPLIDFLEAKWGEPMSFERNKTSGMRREYFDKGWREAIAHIKSDLELVQIVVKKS